MGRVLAWLVVIAVAACARPAPPCPPVPPAVGAPFLWRVHRGAGPSLWLLGTIHNGGAAEIPAEAWAALDAAPQVATELGDVEVDPDTFRQLARLPRGKGLDTLLPADDWWDLRDLLDGRVKPDDLARARPWYALSLLTARMAPSPSPTMDVAVVERGRARHLPIDALETWADELATVAAAVTVADLQVALRARRTMRCELATLVATYRTGDATAMARRLDVEGATALIGDRHRTWLPRLEGYLAADGAFVAVGLSHLLGPGSVLRALADAGYTVERVAGPAPPPP
ncbi:MAG: TraB/GumN family protein [Kofleriaceae bacterium]